MSAEHNIVGEAWTGLRARLVLNDAFWLGFVWSPVAAWLDVLQQQTAEYLGGLGAAISIVHIRTVKDLADLSDEMKSPERVDGLLWLRFTPEADPQLEEATARFFELLNRSRDSLRRSRPNGLVLAAPSGWRSPFREACPDLWSYQSLDVMLEPSGLLNDPAVVAIESNFDVEALLARSGGLRGTLRNEFAERLRGWELDLSAFAANDMERSWAMLKQFRVACVHDKTAAQLCFLSLLEHGVPSAELPTFLLESADLAANTNEPSFAADLLQARFEVLRRKFGEDSPFAVAALAEAARDASRGLLEAGRSSGTTMAIVALELAEKSISKYGESHDRLRLRGILTNDLGCAAMTRGDHAAAGRYFSAYRDIVVRVIEVYGETPERLRELTISHNHRGLVAIHRGDLEAACGHFTDYQAGALRLVAETDVTPEDLLRLAASHGNLGHVAEKRGDLATAIAEYSKYRELSASLITEYGPSLDRVREHVESLKALGRVAQTNGEYAAANACFEECRGLAQRVISLDGPSRNGLYLLAVSNGDLGRVAALRGDLRTAQDRYVECQATLETLIAGYGEGPESVGALGVVYGDRGRIALGKGDMLIAKDCFSESFHRASQVISLYGETLDRLQNLVTAHGDLGRTAEELGDLASAHGQFGESVRLSLRILSAYGETPVHLRGLAIAHNNLGRVAKARAEFLSAHDSFNEAVMLMEHLIGVFGETASRVHDLSFMRSLLHSVDAA